MFVFSLQIMDYESNFLNKIFILSAFHTTSYHLSVRNNCSRIDTSKDIGQVLWHMATDMCLLRINKSIIYFIKIFPWLWNYAFLYNPAEKKNGTFLLHILLPLKISSSPFHTVMDTALEYRTQLYTCSAISSILHSLYSTAWTHSQDPGYCSMINITDEEIVQCQCYFHGAGTFPEQRVW